MPRYHGLYVALVSPFDGHGELNLHKMEELIALHLEAGTEGLVVCGTTGESACLSEDEQARILDCAVRLSAGKMRIFCGAGSRSTEESVEKVLRVRDAGADGALVVTPFYNRPSQEGLFRHFATIAERCEFPLMLYNVPSRTGVDLLPATVKRLASLPHVVALKEARPDIDRISELVTECGDEIDIFTGHDPNFFPALCVGAKGVVSVAANLVPGEMRRLQNAFESGDVSLARTLHQRLGRLCHGLSHDTNPVPVKCAMNLLGWEVGDVRLPLVRLGGDALRAVRDALKAFGFDLEKAPRLPARSS